MTLIRSSDSRCSLALCAAAALLLSTASLAAGRESPETIYQRDRAACNGGQSGQDRAACLREAGAARQEARRGRLDDSTAEFERNRLLRCDRQPPQDREDCVRRMNGEGVTSGSVQGGGILRELTTPVVPPKSN